MPVCRHGLSRVLWLKDCRHLATRTPQVRSAAVPKGRRWQRITLAFALFGSAIVTIDSGYNASALQRTLRTFYYGILTTIDFKLNFNKDKADQIDLLHERVADRLAYVCNKNAGLFIKLGQSIGIQAAILPKPYREAFASIFDAAPPISFEDVRKVFMREFGKDVDDVFESFERKAIASASIAQIHRAKLDGRDVAVKVQKPEIAQQMEWDLFSYKTLLWCYEKIFDIPCYFIAQYVAEQMRKEVSFTHEAENAEKTDRYLSNEPTLRGKVVVPKVIWDWTSERVMTAEMIPDAARLTDKERIEKMGLDPGRAMQLTTNAYAAMLFKWGHLHCDLHPGNVLVRRHPDDAKETQIVLIDHGLYITLPDTFRKSYATFWRALFVMDAKAIDEIARGWGIANSDFFATATLMRPFKVRRKEDTGDQDHESQKQSSYDMQVGLKTRLRQMLENEELIPQELIFVARTMRMIQGNNQTLGSPVNRINILAHWAAVGYQDAVDTSGQSLTNVGLGPWLRDRYKVVVFKLTLLLIDAGFYLTKLRQWLYIKTSGKEEGGFEDLLQHQVSQLARDEFGVELDGTYYVF